MVKKQLMSGLNALIDSLDILKINHIFTKKATHALKVLNNTNMIPYF